MKSILILRDINENFKNSPAKEKIVNSIVHFRTTNLEEGVNKFNKLKVASEMFIIDNDFSGNLIYFLVASKEILSEHEGKTRKLKATILNAEILARIHEKVNDGEEVISLFI